MLGYCDAESLTAASPSVVRVFISSDSATAVISLQNAATFNMMDSDLAQAYQSAFCALQDWFVRSKGKPSQCPLIVQGEGLHFCPGGKT